MVVTPEAEQQFQRAIERVAQSDPLLKLLQEVRLGRMKPTDAGLRAVTDSWLHTYRQVLEGATLLQAPMLRRLDPTPRVAVLIEAGMVTAEHPSVVALLKAFANAVGAVMQERREASQG